MSNSMQPFGQQPTRLLCPQDSLGKNTGVCCHFLLQSIYLSVCVCVCVVCVCVCVCVCVYRPQLDSCVGKIPWRMDRLPTPIFLGFPCDSASKESTCNWDLGLIPGLKRSPGEGKGYLLQSSGLENSMDCRVHGVAESNMTESLLLSLTHTHTHTRPYMTLF